MAKVKNPLFSGDVSGQFGQKMIFRRGGVVTRIFRPRNPNSEAQRAQRELFKEYTVKGLTQAQADLLYSAIGHLHDEHYAALVHSHDHGTLSGLGDDDHPQYFNQTRGDARYSLTSHLHDARYLQDAASDGKNYARKNAAWAEVAASPWTHLFISSNLGISGITMQTLTPLTFATVSYGKYHVRGKIYYTTDAAADWKYIIGVTNGQVYTWRQHILPATTAYVLGYDGGSGTEVSMLSASTNPGFFQFDCYVSGALNPGVFSVKGAQVTANGTTSQVWAGSYIEYYRVA